MPVPYKILFFVTACVMNISTVTQPPVKVFPHSDQTVSSSKSPRVLEFKYTMPGGAWVHAFEPEGGQVVISKKDATLTLSPYVIDRNMVAIRIRFNRNLAPDRGKPFVSEDLIKIEMNKMYSPPSQLASIGFPQSITVSEANSRVETLRSFESQSVPPFFGERGSNIRNKNGSMFQDDPNRNRISNSYNSPDNTSERCCITCDATTHCACFVVTDCGECCYRKCCMKNF